MNRMKLIGTRPRQELGFSYPEQPPYDGVVLGSLTLGQLLRFREEEVLEALAEGKPVYLYTPGLPEPGRNRGLASACAAARRELKSFGILFTDGTHRHLVTAEEAKQLRRSGAHPGPGAVLTPLAREILEGSN